MRAGDSGILSEMDGAAAVTAEVAHDGGASVLHAGRATGNGSGASAGGGDLVSFAGHCRFMKFGRLFVFRAFRVCWGEGRETAQYGRYLIFLRSA